MLRPHPPSGLDPTTEVDSGAFAPHAPRHVEPRWAAGIVRGGVALALIAWGKWCAGEQLGAGAPFLGTSFAVLIAAWVGGIEAGLVVTVAAALMVWATFLPPDADVWSVVWQIAVFLAEGVALSVIAGRLNQEEQQARLAGGEARATLHRLEVVLDTIDEGITVQDRQGRLVYANTTAARMAGLRWPAELLGASPETLSERYELIDTRGEPFPSERLPGRAVLRGQPGSEVVVGYRRRGSDQVRWSVVRAAPIGGRTGTVRFAMNVYRDITESRAREESIARLSEESRASRDALVQARAIAVAANRAKDEFLAVLGHELRNPLAPIRTALQLMRLRGDAAFVQERTIIERQVQHLVRLVDDLLDISRITRGKIELSRIPVELNDLVGRALETVSPLIEQRGHEIAVQVERKLWVYGDAVRLVQVLANLITNAAKYTDPQGHLRLEARRAGRGYVEITVEDDGVGIHPDTLPRVFEPFVQEKQGSDRAHGGLGLGLAISRSLVELHGGTISAHSDGPGRGSRFVVRLPSLSRVKAERFRAPTIPGPVVRRRARILLVDDNADALTTLSDGLVAHGHDVHVATDGPSALEIAPQVLPEVAILDVGLPGMDGYELGQRLRALPGLGNLRLAALTGYGQAADRRQSQAAGFHAHLVKPIALDQILEAIDRLSSET